MSESSLLDTGVVLGFCFRDDSHHHRCRQYLESHELTLYLSDHVEEEYLNREPSLAEEIADGVLAHADCLRNSGFEGQLDSMDISQIRQNYIGAHNSAGTTLYAFYQNEAPNFIQLDTLDERLRDLARDVEQIAIENRLQLEEEAELWERDEDYPGVDDALSAIPWDDRRICLDAHDIAEVTGSITELATTNPTDLVDDGHRKLILEKTSIEDVVSLASRS